MTHVITGYPTTLSSAICKMNNSTSQSSVCLVRSFHSASFRVRCSIRALPSLPHFIISVSRHLISFSESCSTAKHCKGASRSHQSFWQIHSFSIVGLVFRPNICFLRPSMSLSLSCLRSLMVLLVVDESRGDSLCQFACFLVQAIESLSTNYCSSITIFLESWMLTI